MRKIVVGTIIVLAVGAAAIGWWFSQNQSASAPESKPTPSASKSEKPANPNEHNYMDTDWLTEWKETYFNLSDFTFFFS